MMLQVSKIISRGILPLLIFFCTSVQSQQLEGNWWYFGQQAGLHFTNGYPEADTNSPMNSVNAVATVSDENGNLLFLTDGSTVYDSTYQIMPGSNNLTINNLHRSLILKVPSGEDKYYVINTTSGSNRQLVFFK